MEFFAGDRWASARGDRGILSDQAMLWSSAGWWIKEQSIPRGHDAACAKTKALPQPKARH